MNERGGRWWDATTSNLGLIALFAAGVAGTVLFYAALRFTYPIEPLMNTQLDPTTGWRADVTRKLDLLIATSCTCPPSSTTRLEEGERR